MPVMQPILLVAINARYSHTSLGARSLLANMGALRGQTAFLECNINETAAAIAARVTAHRPGLFGVGVYIWNRARIEELLPILRARLPGLAIVLGGPEITYDTGSDLASQADCVIRGEGETHWPAVCRTWIAGRPLPRLLEPEEPRLDRLALPVAEFRDEDFQHRNVYFEASRGCPFACDFCLSAVASGVRRFPDRVVLEALGRYLERGCTALRFVDRSFKTGGRHALAILDFLLERADPGWRLHLEMTPDGLGSALRERLRRFPAGVLHIETGVQSFNPAVLATICRRGDPDAVAEGIAWLVGTARADVHADLIAGLPGETMASFTTGFDRLYRLGPSEIQVGILKKLHGAPLERHIRDHAMRFLPVPPYTVVETAAMSTGELSAIVRFASHWERLVNRRRFPLAIGHMLSGAESPWQRFDAFSRDLAARHGNVGFGMVEAAAVLLPFMVAACGVPPAAARDLLARDYRQGGKRLHLPRFLA